MKKYEIKNSDFHGAGHVAFTASIATGVRAIKRLEPKGCQSGQCLCGGLQLYRRDGQELRYLEKMEKERISRIVYNY